MTPEKQGLTKRLVFRRRERMRGKNLIVIYYDGVLGDTNNQQSYNPFRMRYGSVTGMRKLYQWA